jgi:hypothetical protein
VLRTVDAVRLLEALAVVVGAGDEGGCGELASEEGGVVVALDAVFAEEELDLLFLLELLSAGSRTALCSSFFFFSYRLRMRFPIASRLSFSISLISSLLASQAITFNRARVWSLRQGSSFACRSSSSSMSSRCFSSFYSSRSSTGFFRSACYTRFRPASPSLSFYFYFSISLSASSAPLPYLSGSNPTFLWLGPYSKWL